MASIVPRGESWQARVRAGGFCKVATFATESAARAWADKLEADIHAGRYKVNRITEEDAARYRWLRDKSLAGTLPAFVEQHLDGLSTALVFDEVIDRAIKRDI